MAIRIMASWSAIRYSASVRASSVLPTPVGPRKIKLPTGRFGSLMPALARRTASATAFTALSCPTTRSWSTPSRLRSRAASSWTMLVAGTPVHSSRMRAMSSRPTSGELSSRRPAQPSCCSRSSALSCSWRCLRVAAFPQSSAGTARALPGGGGVAPAPPGPALLLLAQLGLELLLALLEVRGLLVVLGAHGVVLLAIELRSLLLYAPDVPRRQGGPQPHLRGRLI